MGNERGPQISVEPDEVQRQDAAELPDREAMSVLNPGGPVPYGPPVPIADSGGPIAIDDPKPADI